jgi:hypothetical protein
MHTTEPGLAGGSMYMQQVDPWLGYLWGRELVQREWRPRDGVFGETGKPDGLLLPDGVTHAMSRDHVNSCAACHNTPYRDGGSGMTIPKNGGTGRDSPHFFGAGLIEMLGARLRLAALSIADDDRNGWIDLMEAKDERFLYDTLPDSVDGQGATIDFGRFDDYDLDGQPDLNPILYVIFVDGQGRRIPWAEKLTDPGVKGYRLLVQMFGQGQRRVSNRPPLPGTVRAFAANAFDIHLGLQAYDPTALADDDGDDFAGISNAGALQVIFSAGRDRGRVVGPTGVSLDDPDRDGVCHELTEGDLDVVEWYMLNHPRPGRGRQSDRTRHGELLLSRIGCTACHVPDWYLPAANLTAQDYTQRHAGDRRFFDVEVDYDNARRQVAGRFVQLTDRVGNRHVPRRGSFTIRSLYSDFKYHDVGPQFHQVQYDGSVVTHFRTAPLWGAGSTAPYGHDGASLDLDAAIVRHAGEAQVARDAYLALDDDDQEALLAFLRSLVLYQTDRLPCDIDGDGQISDSFEVADRAIGLETLRPEWLLNQPCQIEGPDENILGQAIVSMAVTNVREAYGLDLPYLIDADHDGWPDCVETDSDPSNPLKRSSARGDSPKSR